MITVGPSEIGQFIDFEPGKQYLLLVSFWRNVFLLYNIGLT